MVAATAIAVVTTCWFAWGIEHFQPTGTDFDQLWAAARMLASGRDPYELIGPGREFPQQWPLFYPITGVLPAFPFAWLSLPVARLCFCFVTAFPFAFLISKHGWHRLVACLSGSYLSAMSLQQWGPLAACAVMAPSVFGWMLVGKPNLGIVTGATAKDASTVIWYAWWSVVAVLFAFALLPSWFGEWRSIVTQTTHVRPYIVRPFGFLLLLALLRYRDPAARFLVALALVPTTASSPDALILFAFPHTFRQGLVLAILTHALNFYVLAHPKPVGDDAVSALNATAALWFAFLPALAVVLTRRRTLANE